MLERWDTMLVLFLSSLQLLTLFIASSKDPLLDMDIVPVPILNLAVLEMTILTIVFETLTIFQCLVFLYATLLYVFSRLHSYLPSYRQRFALQASPTIKDLCSFFVILPTCFAITFASATACRQWRAHVIGGAHQIVQITLPFVPILTLFVLGPYLVHKFFCESSFIQLIPMFANNPSSLLPISPPSLTPPDLSSRHTALGTTPDKHLFLTTFSFFLVYLYIFFFYFPSSSTQFDLTSLITLIWDRHSIASITDTTHHPTSTRPSPNSKFIAHADTPDDIHIPLYTTSQREILVALSRVTSAWLAFGLLVILVFMSARSARSAMGPCSLKGWCKLSGRNARKTRHREDLGASAGEEMVMQDLG
ncbi:hypothetical protein K435DRAFT_512409 [Dendrothele bispora CBS 962.96]|uniref:Uncharacterized protein n=1 Tax=Dendrothele bispora (strain CBS 962.96) TaxID=1314807 RepID=A0A4S8KW84_DENBC|nr:hypothetical protein K435DRAFT_512409 [Dendrothele bispora CBS 962.96]